MTDGIVVLIFILVFFIVTAIYGEIEVRRYLKESETKENRNMGLIRANTSGGGSGGATKYEKVTRAVSTNTNTTITFNSLSKIWGVRVLNGGSHCCDAFYDSENDTYSIFNTNGSNDSGYFMIKSVTDNSIVYWQKWSSSINITAVAVGD